MTLKQAILATLRYSDHFGFPLKQEEILIRLINYRIVSKTSLTRSLNSLKKQQIIGHTKGYYYLSNHSSLVASRQKKELVSHLLLHHARTLATLVAKSPGVLAVYLTGSLAVQNAGGDGDIDLMIITYPGKLWTTRFILTLYTSLLRLRRSPNSKLISGKLCLNLYLTPKSYLVPGSRRTLYTAYELIQAVPLYDPQNTHIELLSTNSWITSFLPNYIILNPKSKTLYPRLNKLSQLVERILYKLQFMYMHSKITREYITPHSAYFHPHNPGNSVLKKLSL